MTVNPAGGSGTAEGRDGWCTPKWLADIINLWEVALDPCSNERSHIRAYCCYALPVDGIRAKVLWNPWDHVFINPPYAHGQVIQWVHAYSNKDFVFLLRWDPSTEWYAELWQQCWGAWFPNRRINFEPPPGVKSSSNPYPHALYFKSKPAGKFLAALLANGYLLAHADIEEATNRVRESAAADPADHSTSLRPYGSRDGVPNASGWGEGFSAQAVCTPEEWDAWQLAGAESRRTR